MMPQVECPHCHVVMLRIPDGSYLCPGCNCYFVVGLIFQSSMAGGCPVFTKGARDASTD